ncbi:hypothetical protein K8D10_00995 [Aeromonas veronii]|uniref:hypothetical protein n=1 Tax=Aeromonas veronii TaxID=654 RepID=UPI00207C53A9|nr:hypothetical protein [Aeromonas veronii]MCO4170378.1 hypothetical protein [Aeromonas veronii]
MANRIFLEKSKFIEKIAVKLNIKSHDTDQSKRNSISSMTKKASDDYRLLINKITFHLCHNDRDSYEDCKCKECRSLSGVLSKHGLQLFSLYDFIVKQNIDISVDPHLVRMAVLDVFILPYLMRVVSELKEKFHQNRTLWHLDRYIKFVVRDASNSEPLLKAFLREHVASVPFGLYVNKERYQYNPVEYQSWGKFFEFASNELNQVNKRNETLSSEDDKKRWAEARSWHCAGNIVHELLNLMNASSKGYAPWRGSSLTTRLHRDYDFLYDTFLSLNRDMQFSLFRSDKVNLNLVINNNVECYLTLDRKAILQGYLSDEAKFGISLRKNALLDASLKHENKTKSSKPKKIAFNKYLKQPSALNLRFDYAARGRCPGDDDAEFNIIPREDANIEFVIGADGQFTLSFNKDATFDLRSNKHIAANLNIEDKREYGHKELRCIFTVFKYAIQKRNIKGISLTEIEEINSFCKKALNGKPAIEEIRKEEKKLKALLKGGQSNRYTSFLAWCIFIAKSKHGKLKLGKEILYCESRILEHQDDYVGNRINEHIHQLKYRAIHADFKRDVLYRLGYIRIYNKLVMGDFEHSRPRAIDKSLILNWRVIDGWPSNAPRMLSLLGEDRYTGEVINPFIELEKYIDSILRWDSRFSSKVTINRLAIESYPKSTEKSLNWLIFPNVSSNYKQKKPQHDYTKMRLCRTCSVRLYPELMTLAGLRHNPKIASLKEHEFERLISLLKPCQCRTINDFELTENMETGNADTCYWVPDYYSKSISF